MKKKRNSNANKKSHFFAAPQALKLRERETAKNKGATPNNPHPQEKQSKPKARAFPANETLFLLFAPAKKRRCCPSLFFPLAPPQKTGKEKICISSRPFLEATPRLAHSYLDAHIQLRNSGRLREIRGRHREQTTPRLQCVGACLRKLTKVQPICRAGFRQPPLPSSP